MKRKTSDEKYEHVVEQHLNNMHSDRYLPRELFDYLFTVERKVNNRSRISKKGKLCLSTTGETIEYESLLEKTILNVLDNSSKVAAIRTQSLMLTYKTRNEYVYYPDIVYLTSDGFCVVLEVKDTVSMFKSTNLKKYACLKAYCASNGYGYSMLNDKCSFDSLLSMPISDVKCSQLSKLFGRKQSVSWSSIKDDCKFLDIRVEEVLVYGYRNGWSVSSPKSRVWAFTLKRKKVKV